MNTGKKEDHNDDPVQVCHGHIVYLTDFGYRSACGRFLCESSKAGKFKEIKCGHCRTYYLRNI